MKLLSIEESKFQEPSYEISFSFRKILVPTTSYIGYSENVIKIAIDMALRYGSHIEFLYLRTSNSDNEYLKLKYVINEYCDKFGIDCKFTVIDVKNEDSIRAIVKYVKENMHDLVILNGKTCIEDDLKIGNSLVSILSLILNVSVLIVR